jgi:hypothetical protein
MLISISLLGCADKGTTTGLMTDNSHIKINTNRIEHGTFCVKCFFISQKAAHPMVPE